MPSALGGGDEPCNLIELTYREHFLAHWLLTKICEGKAKSLMLIALHCMTMEGKQGRVISGWQFEVVKRALRNNWLQRIAARKAAIVQRRQEEKEKIKARAWQAIRRAPEITIVRNHRDELSQLATAYLRAAPRKSQKRKTAFFAEFNR